ncbi:MAG: FAD-binding protein, partial [Clostridia bacterium]|nr:FAD-binding protein [Clostridia bacterium]
EINEKCEVANTKNLFASGEVVGGIHGRNRLMGNSLLDVIVFGRESGRQAAARAKEVDHVGRLNLDHVAEFEQELSDAWVDTGVVSPKLFPNYKANFRTYLDTSFSSDKADEQ